MSFELSDIPKVVPPPIALDTSGEQPATPSPVTASPDLTGLPPHDLTRANLLEEATQPPPAQDIIGEHPWDVEDAARDQAKAQWRMDYQATNDRAALEEEKFYKDKDLSFHRDPAMARMLATNDSFLVLHNDGLPLPPGELNRRMFRVQKAEELFGGKGAESEEAFHAQIVAGAQGRRDTKALATRLTATAFDDAMLPSDQAGGFTKFRETLKTLPGYDPAREADYYQHWLDTRRKGTEMVDAFRPQLVNVWRAFRTDGNITAAAFDAWKGLTPEQRPTFLDALAIRAKALPDAERRTFWQNAERGFELGMKDFYRAAGESATSLGLAQPTSESVALADLFHGTDQYATQEAARKQAAADYREKRNFAADIRRIAREDYDPIRSAFGDGGEPGFWENQAYTLPATLASSVTMAVPVAGPALMTFSMEGQAYEDLRGRFLAAGMDDIRASDYAEGLAPLVALPQAAMEKVGFNLWARKLPGFSTALDTLGDRVTNRLFRGTLKTGTIAGAETVIELGQTFTSHAVQDLAAALSEDVPDVQWTGGGGALEGAWRSVPEMLPAMLVFGILGAHGGLNLEARATSFRSSSTLQKQALGFTPESIAAIEAAEGPASLHRAIDAAWASRDANSESARTAVGQLAVQAASLSNASQKLVALGYPLPKITAHTDGTFTINDASGKELGTAPDLSGAQRIANTHISSIETLSADRIAEMGTMLRGAGILATEHGVEQQLEPGHIFTAEEAAAISPESAERIAEERALLEETNGGSRDMSVLVLGQHTREIRGNLHQDVTTLYHGAHLGTMLEELAHAKWRAARAGGLTNRQEEISILRAFDTVLAKATRGKALRFIPDGMGDADVTDTRIEEAIGQIAQMEIFRTPKDGKNAFGLPRDLVSAHIGAVGKITGQGTAWKFKSFIEALRTRMGLTMERTFVMKKAEKSGEFDRTPVDAYLAKLVGIESSQVWEGNEGTPMGPTAGGSTATQQDVTGSADDTTPAMVGDPSPERTFIARVWNTLAENDELFQFGRTESPDAEKIAEAVSTPNSPIEAYLIKPTRGSEVSLIRFYSSSGSLEIMEAHTDRPYISSLEADSQGKQGGGGSQLYMAALDWIHNNGKTLRDDPGGLSRINEVRRTSNFLASALRWKTTKHLSPHAKQKLPQWTSDDDINIQNLAIKEMENVHEAIPESIHWSFDFDEGNFRDAKGDLLTINDLRQTVKSHDPGSNGIGLTTLQRAIITNSALRESRDSTSANLHKSKESGLPTSLIGISYSLGPLNDRE